jgi:hypothetical protein
MELTPHVEKVVVEPDEMEHLLVVVAAHGVEP